VLKAPVFTGAINLVDDSQRQKMIEIGSWREGCPVPISDLRIIAVSFWNYDGRPKQGEIMVHEDVAADVLDVFRMLYEARFPIKRMELVEKYDADDEISMLYDNTSAFNCRYVGATKIWSQHAYGKAIDINPFENPEVRNGVVDPPGTEKYIDRSINETGMIKPNVDVVQAFKSIGWKWGGNWTKLKDYQHFSQNGQ